MVFEFGVIGFIDFLMFFVLVLDNLMVMIVILFRLVIFVGWFFVDVSFGKFVFFELWYIMYSIIWVILNKNLRMFGIWR